MSRDVVGADTSAMRRVALLVSVAVIWPATASAATDVHVSAYDVGAFDLFSPSDVDLRQGDTVIFDFDGPSSHTATDGTGLDLFDSGVVGGGGPSFAYTYVAAGRYAFVCTLHAEMAGVAHVPVVVRPATTAPGTTVTVRWSTQPADPGLVYDAQIRRPGGTWRAWLTGVTTRRSTFEPARTGVYRFRARMRATGSGAASRWSAAGLVTVG